MTQKTNPWTFDVRVRERNLKAGSLTEKDVEKYLSSLPDSSDQAESFATAQPALEQPEVALADEGDDDEDEGDDDVADTSNGTAMGGTGGGEGAGT